MISYSYFTFERKLHDASPAVDTIQHSAYLEKGKQRDGQLLGSGVKI
jgi:hypothetical protein